MNAEKGRDLPGTLERIAADQRRPEEVLAGYANLETDKYHPVLAASLVAIDMASSRLDFDGARDAADELRARK